MLKILRSQSELQTALENDWLVSTGQLAELLETTPAALVRQESATKFGFVFTRAENATVGKEIMWHVSKPTKKTRKSTR